MLKSLQNKLFIVTTNSWSDLLMHAFLAVSIIGITALLFIFSFLPSVTDHGQVVTVPDLREMSIEEASSFLYQRGMSFEIKDTAYSRKHKLGVILSQSPEAGEKVKRGRRLALTINPKTPPKTKIPDLDGQQIDDARRMLENAGLDIGRITYKPDLGKDVVLEYYVNGRKMDTTLIRKGYYATVGTKIDMLVADGRGETEFNVPNMIGLSEEEAEEVANVYEISLHKSYDYKSKRPLGTVIWQNPPTHVGVVRTGSADEREKNKLRSGDIIDVRIAGNPSAKPMNETEMYEYERKKDSMERSNNYRSSKDMKKFYKEWEKERKIKEEEEKKKNPKKDDKKESKTPTPKGDPK